MKRVAAWALVAPAIILACTSTDTVGVGGFPDGPDAEAPTESGTIQGNPTPTPDADVPEEGTPTVPEVCGDGRLAANEQCDDGNTDSNDGCSSDCELESTGPLDLCPGIPLTLTAQGSGESGSISGSTTGTYGQYAGSCGGGTGNDAVYVVTPSVTGRLTAKVTGTFDTLIYARSTCDETKTELACKDGFGGAGNDVIKVPVTQGEPVYLFVDGFSGAEGDFTVTADITAAYCGDGIAQVPEVCDDGNTVAGDGCAPDCTFESGGVIGDCPGQAIMLTGSRTISLTNQTAGTGSTQVSNGCLGGANNHVYAFMTDVDGSLHAHLVAKYDKPVLHARSECDTQDTQLDCVDSPTSGLPLDLNIPIKANLPVYVIVDGATGVISQAGTYALDVSVTAAQCGNHQRDTGEQCDDGNTTAGDGCAANCTLEPIATAADTCPGQPITLTQGADGTYATAFTSSTATFASDVKGKGAAPACSVLATAKDAIYVINPPVNGRITATVKSWFDAMLYARTACLDTAVTADLACSVVGDGTAPETISFPAVAGTPIYLMVDGELANQSGTFELSVSLAPQTCGNGILDGSEACDDGNLAPGDGCNETCKLEPVTGHDTCANAETLNLVQGAVGEYNASVSSGTSNLANDQTFSTACASVGPDAMYKFVAPVDGVLTATITSAGFNVSLGARTTCTQGIATAPLICSNTTADKGNEEINVSIVKGQTYYLIVDGVTATDLGAFSMNVVIRPSGCGDGLVTGTEQCDDMNQISGDGCTSSCTLETLPGIDTCNGFTLPLTGTTTQTGVVTVDTSKLAANYGGSCGGSSKEGVVVITPNINGKITARLTGQTYQPVLYVRTTCDDPATERACSIDATGATSARDVTVAAVTAGTPVYLFIDGYNGSAGVGRLNVTVTP